MRGRTVGGSNDSFYKWQISMYDFETDTTQTSKYFSIKHFNDTHGTNYNSDHVQKLTKLRSNIGDYTMDDVKKARLTTPGSVLAKIGNMKFCKIREPVIYEVTRRILN
jgi:hypothetical protein